MKTLSKAPVVFVLVGSVVVPLAFFRGVIDSFDLTKFTIVLLLGALLAPIAIKIVLDNWSNLLRSPSGVAALVFGLTALLATLTSERPIVSMWGQYQRYTGSLTLLSVTVLAVVIAGRFDHRDLQSLSRVLVLVQLAINFYAWLQFSGRDPWTWSSGSFSRFVMSTLGNPNTASAFTAITLPLAIGLIARWRTHMAWATAASAVFCSSVFFLPIYNSFQGNVGLVASVGALCLTLRQGGVRLSNALVVAVHMLTIALLLVRPEKEPVLLIGFAGVVLTMALARWKISRSMPLDAEIRIPVRRTLLLLGGLVALSVVFLHDEFARGIKDGLSERKYFYSAAWSAFLERPILGYGPETFGFVYASFRPAEHARLLEGSITSSVHSIPLGMFASGGIFLGLAFLVLLATVFRAGVVGLRKHEATLDDTTPWFLCSFAAFIVISLVSVESIHLYFLVGLIVGALMASVRSVSTPAPKRRRPAASNDSRLAVAGVVLALALSPLLTKYFRADATLMKATKEINTQSTPVQALASFKRATRLAPWEGTYAFQYAQVLAYSGDLPAAAEEALRAAELSNFLGSAAPQLASIVLSAGRIDEGFALIERAIALDPFASGLKNAAVSLYRQVADYEAQQGLSDAAAQHRARADELTALAG